MEANLERLGRQWLALVALDCVRVCCIGSAGGRASETRAAFCGCDHSKGPAHLESARSGNSRLLFLRLIPVCSFILSLSLSLARSLACCLANEQSSASDAKG